MPISWRNKNLFFYFTQIILLQFFFFNGKYSKAHYTCTHISLYHSKIFLFIWLKSFLSWLCWLIVQLLPRLIRIHCKQKNMQQGILSWISLKSYMNHDYSSSSTVISHQSGIEKSSKRFHAIERLLAFQVKFHLKIYHHLLCMDASK